MRCLLAEDCARASSTSKDLGTGAIWVPASAAARPILERGAKELGVTVYAVARHPSGSCSQAEARAYRSLRSVRRLHAFRLDPLDFRAVRISLQGRLSAGARCRRSREELRCLGLRRRRHSRRRSQRPRRWRRIRRSASPKPEDIPAEYRPWLGRITPEKTYPQIRQFIEAGGAVITIGSSTSLGQRISAFRSPARSSSEPPMAKNARFRPRNTTSPARC